MLSTLNINFNDFKIEEYEKKNYEERKMMREKENETFKSKHVQLFFPLFSILTK